MIFTDAFAFEAGEWFEQCMSAPRTAVARHLCNRYIARPLIPLGDVVIQGLNDGVYATSLGGECLYFVQCLGRQPTQTPLGGQSIKSR